MLYGFKVEIIYYAYVITWKASAIIDRYPDATILLIESLEVKYNQK